MSPTPHPFDKCGLCPVVTQRVPEAQEGSSHWGESILPADALAAPFSDELRLQEPPTLNNYRLSLSRVGLGDARTTPSSLWAAVGGYGTGVAVCGSIRSESLS